MEKHLNIYLLHLFLLANKNEYIALCSKKIWTSLVKVRLSQILTFCLYVLMEGMNCAKENAKRWRDKGKSFGGTLTNSSLMILLETLIFFKYQNKSKIYFSLQLMLNAIIQRT